MIVKQKILCFVEQSETKKQPVVGHCLRYFGFLYFYFLFFIFDICLAGYKDSRL